MPPSRPPSPISRVLVLGAGNFGSCLADHLADSEHKVFLWARDAAQVEMMNVEHKNSKYLKDHVFPASIQAIGPELPNEDVLHQMDVILFAVPTQALRTTLQSIHSKLRRDDSPLLIFVNKGIESETQALTLEIIADTCGPDIARIATFLSGPSFAKEIVRRQPTSVSVVSFSQEHAERATNLFHQPWFRCYTGQDPIGVELAGALKNVYAIAAGMADGMGFENNTRAAIVTRALAEMTRIGVAYGASPLTFLTLAGVGDLMLTCSSPTSRNYTVGHRLGKGERLEHVLETLGSVAEGVTTAKGAQKIIEDLRVPAPLATGVYKVLYEGKTVEAAAQWLMAQPPVAELELPVEAPVKAILRKLGVPDAREAK
ncbi:glycerol-3-phosphate dehydrogenase [Sistotremastrum suecicum HHB10207 ss-3]|nr:glycerol-3-phosphate dehydrogenase [Sistotremastrum suecicum HHB10207 ss-3]